MGQGGERCHAVVVDNLHAGGLAGLLLADGGHATGRDGSPDREQQGYQRGARLAQLAQQAAELLATGQQHPDHAQAEQGVAEVGEWRAPGVVAHAEDGALTVGVERRLVEPVALALHDVVHGDADGVALAYQGAHEVGRQKTKPKTKINPKTPKKNKKKIPKIKKFSLRKKNMITLHPKKSPYWINFMNSVRKNSPTMKYMKSC